MVATKQQTYSLLELMQPDFIDGMNRLSASMTALLQALQAGNPGTMGLGSTSSGSGGYLVSPSSSGSGTSSSGASGGMTAVVQPTVPVDPTADTVLMGTTVVTAFQDSWVVGTGSTINKIVPQLAVPQGTNVDVTGKTAKLLKGAQIAFVNGKNVGVIRDVADVSNNGTMTMDSPLPYAPQVGDQFLLYDNSSSSAPPAEVYYANHLAVTANTDIMASPLTPSDEGTFEIRVMLDQVATFYVIETPITVDAGDETATKGAMNAGSSLNADAWYAFSLPVGPNGTVQFQTDTSCNAAIKVQFKAS